MHKLSTLTRTSECTHTSINMQQKLCCKFKNKIKYENKQEL